MTVGEAGWEETLQLLKGLDQLMADSFLKDSRTTFECLYPMMPLPESPTAWHFYTPVFSCPSDALPQVRPAAHAHTFPHPEPLPKDRQGELQSKAWQLPGFGQEASQHPPTHTHCFLSPAAMWVQLLASVSPRPLVLPIFSGAQKMLWKQ